MKKKIAMFLAFVMYLSTVFCGTIFADVTQEPEVRVFKFAQGIMYPQIHTDDSGTPLYPGFGYHHSYTDDDTLTITKTADGYYEIKIEYIYDGMECVYAESTDPSKRTILPNGTTSVTQLHIYDGMLPMEQYTYFEVARYNTMNDRLELEAFIEEVLEHGTDDNFYARIDAYHRYYVYDPKGENIDAKGVLDIQIGKLIEVTPTTPAIANGNYTGTGSAYVLTPFGRFNIATLPLTKATISTNSINLSFRANTLQYNVLADKVSYNPTTGANTYQVVINDSTVNNGTWDFTITPTGEVTGTLTSPNGDTLNFTMILTPQ